MRFRKIVGSTLCLAATLAAYADWQALRTIDGRVVEVVAEFKIEACSVASNGDTTIEAWCTEGREKLGLSLEISKPRKSEVAQVGGEAPLPIFRSDLAIKPVGQFVDAPMNRLVAYFSLPGGYGGTSIANQTRLQWYDALFKKKG